MVSTMHHTSNEPDQIVCNPALDSQTNKMNLFNSIRWSATEGLKTPEEIPAQILKGK